MELKGKRVAILLEEFYEDPEYWYPYYRFLEAGAEVKTVAPEIKIYKSKYGYPATADLSAEAAQATDFDAVIVPGGYSPDRMRRSPKMIQFLREAFVLGKVVAAICHGPWMLASVGALKGKKATSYFSIKDDIVHAGAEYLDQPVVRDGNLITSRIPGDLPQFCQEIIKSLQ
jgi:protease I